MAMFFRGMSELLKVYRHHLRDQRTHGTLGLTDAILMEWQ
jgi:hypothetical protein